MCSSDLEVLVLDEPANGLDPAGRDQVHRTLTRLAAEGVAVLLSSHRMDDLAVLCEEVTLLATGRVVFSGTLAKLATEVGELDHRLRVREADAVAALVADRRDVRLLGRAGEDTLLLHGSSQALEALVGRVLADGLGLLEFAPVVTPLEAAFRSLVDRGAEVDA